MYDLILRNGRLTDPENGFDGAGKDIGVKDGRIEKIAPSIGEGGLHEIDVSGRAVLPGLIDFHAHFYAGGTLTSLHASSYLSTGVTGAVDAGSAGVSNFEALLESLTERERRNCRMYLNVASEGLSCLGSHNENINPAYFDKSRILKMCNTHREQIIGLKIRISSEIAKQSNTTSFDALRGAVEAANACGLPLSVHMPDFQGSLSELIDILRPGDIFCHVFTPQKGILENGSVSGEMIRARKKGIILESACGKGHFGHETARKAMGLGLLPDLISGDFTRNTFLYEPAFSLPYLMSRFMALGMTLPQVTACCASFPAKLMGMKGEIGCLKEGAKANLSVFEIRKGEFMFTDVLHDTVTGSEMLCPSLTVLEGETVYRALA